jgi:aromatic ring-cleaving dioxygenase
MRPTDCFQDSRWRRSSVESDQLDAPRHILTVKRQVGPDTKMMVAAQFRISRQTLHAWLTRSNRGLAGLMDVPTDHPHARTEPPPKWNPGM